MRPRARDGGSRCYALGFLTTDQVCDEYGTCEATLMEMRRIGALSVRAPVGQTRPLYYRREELDLAFLGLRPEGAAGPAR